MPLSKAIAPLYSLMDKQDQEKPTQWQENNKSFLAKFINKTRDRVLFQEQSNNCGAK